MRVIATEIQSAKKIGERKKLGKGNDKLSVKFFLQTNKYSCNVLYFVFIYITYTYIVYMCNMLFI